jgi:apolipoprotein N-acyltransferase
MRGGEGRIILSSLSIGRLPRTEDGNEEDVLNLHSQRLSFTLFVKNWWAAITSASATYGFLLTAQPPRDSAESAYFFLFPAILWFSFEPNIRKVAITFLFAGWLYYVTLVGWIRHITLPGMICATFLLSLYNLLWFLLARRLIPQAMKGGFPARLLAMIGLSSAWVVIEWARCQFTLGFPWCPLSVTQWERPAILQMLPWTGAWSVSFFLVFFNLSLASYVHHLLVRRRSAKGGMLSSFCPDFYAGILLFAIMMSPFLLTRSTGRRADPEQRTIKIGVCQPYLLDKWKEGNVAHNKEILKKQTKVVSLMEPDLIVWPEASTPYALNLDPLWVEELARESGIPMLIGAVVKEEGSSFNTISKVLPGEGVFPEWYAKRVLVPFGEYVPFPFRWLPGLRKLVGPVGNFGEGDVPFTFDLEFGEEGRESYRVGPLICYEDIFPEVVRQTVREGVDFLFVSTNDAWFGEEGCAEQHAAHSVMRAVENRIPILRCGNAGWSGWIDQKGNQRAVLKDEDGSIYFQAASTFEMRFPSRPIISSGNGYPDYFIWFCIGYTIWMLVRMKNLRFPLKL